MYRMSLGHVYRVRWERWTSIPVNSCMNTRHRDKTPMQPELLPPSMGAVRSQLCQLSAICLPPISLFLLLYFGLLTNSRLGAKRHDSTGAWHYSRFR